MVRDGAAGEAMLIKLLASNPDDKNAVIVALGEACGNAGIPILHAIAADRGATIDERCSALVALAKRQGSDASETLARALLDEDRVIRRYGLLCMAYVGDGRSWDAVLYALRVSLAGPAPRFPFALNPAALFSQSEVLPPIAYLARFATNASREEMVVGLVSSNWDKLYNAEQEWLRSHWLACDPNAEKPMPPNLSRIQSWIQRPFFAPLYVD
ncbi:HEAT repeat domain-containing protein [Micromonospora gifhornensis]|nr:hypothetical protein [Micromonospora gifhornensis]